MSSLLHVLILEDNPYDAELMTFALREEGFDLNIVTARGEAEYRTALMHAKEGTFDVILADYSLPQFNALRALALAREWGCEAPFIIVSGVITDEMAVKAIKQGAADYLLKDRLGRLGAAVRRALEEQVLRQEKLAAEAERRLSEERWHRLVISHPETILITVEGSIAFINQAGAEVFGVASPEVLLGRPIADFIHADNHADLTARQEALMTGETLAPFLYKLIRPSGEERFVEAVSVPISYRGQRAAQTVFRDVTERLNYEQGLIEARDQAERMASLRSSILTNMSHEIRTPLTAILGFAEVLGEEVPEAQKPFVRLIYQAGRRLADTLNSVLDLARLEAGGLELQHSRLDLVEEVVELVSLLVPLAESKGLKLHVEYDAAPLWVDLDAVVLGRVINNLVGNAIKFTEEGHVTVSLAATADQVRMTVQDTGIGIDAQFLPHIFDEFKQESTGMGRSFEGNGLGLTITKRLVEMAGGSVTVLSDPGHGTTFSILLPRFVSEAAAENAEGYPAAVNSVMPELPRILSVEDQEEARLLIHHILQSDYHLTFAHNGREAIDLALDHQYDLVLMDINLGDELEGTDLLQILRSRNGYSDVPIIAVTAYALPGDQERFLSLGFDAYLSKPYHRSQLLDLVRKSWRPG